VRQFVEHLHRMFDAGAAEVVEIPLDEAESLGDAGGHRLLNPWSVPLEFVDHNWRGRAVSPRSGR
jgi:hypothetical protein